MSSVQEPLPRVVAPFALALLCLVLGAIAAAGVIWLAVLIGDAFPPGSRGRLAYLLHNSVLFLPLPLAFWAFRHVSAWFYRHEGTTGSLFLAHVGHCIALYAMVAWKVYAEVSCVGIEPPIPNRCADLFAVYLTVALVAVGGVAGDAVAVRQELARLVSPAPQSASARAAN